MSTQRVVRAVALLALALSGTSPARADVWKDLAKKAEAAAKKKAAEAEAALKRVLPAPGTRPTVPVPMRDIARRVAPVAERLFSQLTNGPLSRAQASMTGFEGELAGKLRLLELVLRTSKGYRGKLAELRAARARPAPIATGFDPRAAFSTAGRARLASKAAVYEAATEASHVHYGVLYKEVTVDAKTRALRAAAALGDSSYHNGQYLAARAYKFGVTGAAEDLAALERILQGVERQMTIASAPNGRIVDPRTGAVVAGRVGLPVRGFADDASPYFVGNGDVDFKRHEVYVYEGTLAGLPGKRYRLMADVSRDQLCGLMLGLQAAHEVLTRRNAAPEWRARVANLVGTFVRTYIAAGYRIIDLNGAVTAHGDGTQMNDPVTLMFNLAWVKIAAHVTGAQDLQRAYDELVHSKLGSHGFRGAALSGLLRLLASPVARENHEAMRYLVSDFNYNLLMLTLHPLLRLERGPVLRAIYVGFLQDVLWPLMADLRVPFFDYVYLLATGKRDALLRGRAAGVLAQFRGALTPWANPADPKSYVTDFSTRQELRDPLFDYLNTSWATELAPKLKQTGPSPFKAGGGIWPLGPGLVSADNNLERATPYRLRGTGWQCGDGICQYAGHDYLLSYWFGRYHGQL